MKPPVLPKAAEQIAPHARRLEILLAAAALLLFSLALGLLQYGQLEQRFREDLEIQARIVADNAAAAVVFEARAEAAEILAALRSAPAIEEARLLRAGEEELASYRDRRSSTRWLHAWAGQVELSLPVQAQRERVGRLLVRASRVGVWEDLLRFVGGAAGLMLATLLLTWLATRRLRSSVREAERRTLHLAHHDPLTDLPNRESFRSALERAAAQCRTQPAALLFVDLDNFKQINDSHGHLAGDRVLRRVAALLQAQCGPGDLAARLAGDEFALLLGADAARAQAVAERLIEQLPQPLDAELPVHVSIGAALLPEHADNAGDAMRWADAAMYQAKRRGKDGYQLYSEEIGAALRERLALEQELREALAARQLCLAYQPLFDAEGRVRGIEALARWPHPVRGAVSPADFIPIAESTGLIVELSLLSLEVLAADLQRWRAAGLQPPPVAFNLSSRQCRQPLHRSQLLDALERLGLGPQQLEFELTEGTLFEDMEAPDSMIVQLQQRGYALALDDFGTGYSSLAYLRRLRCQKLKIDRLFVHGVARNAEARLLVESVIRLSHAMGMQVVAEGVERAADWDCLRALDCDLYQGFGLSRPLAPEALQELLLAQREGARTRIPAA
jgi:diguanylate cyclase (GGDEF)-like protein